MWFFVGDKGACRLPKGAGSPIYVTSWGLTVPWRAMVEPNGERWRREEEEEPAKGGDDDELAPCAHPSRDIVIPPWFNHWEEVSGSVFTWPSDDSPRAIARTAPGHWQ